MAPAPSLMSVDDYFTKTPETLRPMELVYGLLRAADSPTPRHQQAVFQLALALNAHVSERGLGRVWVAPLDVVLDEERALIVQPDLFFVSEERAAIVRDRVRGAPDLVVEVLSPYPRIGGTEERVEWFGRYGVRECWLVRQDQRSIAVIRFPTPTYTSRGIASRREFARGERIESGVLPEFALRLDDVLT
ncbi:MAG TPA: Uma2 family endonuclease [Vicinamibacterales bacterium]|nr:Uma2 family endonuclease [Vicinamibacterales bacterium]